jgi:ABC-type nitrate/sulfonate/bicarbonate transport system permease component
MRGSLAASVIVAWELAPRLLAIPDYLLPPPSIVAAELIARFTLLARHAGVTLGEVAVGLAAAVGGGAVLAVAMASMPFLQRGLYPLLAFLQAVPKVTVAPLFLIWLGYGLGSKVLMVFLIAFFPIAVNLTTGLLLVDAELLRLMRSYRATGWQVFRAVRVPNALPFFLAGLKIAVALAVVGAVVAEFVGSDRGLGYLILLANAELRTPLLFACLVWLGAIGVGLFALMHWLERLSPWASAALRRSPDFSPHI